jgi:hypothetical protein
MALYSALQASTDLTTFGDGSVTDREAVLVAKYQYIFDLITAAAQTGRATLSIKITRADYQSLVDLLISSGYTVSSFPDITTAEALSTASINISWPTTLISSIAGILPTLFEATVDSAYTVTFFVTGGLAPYKWTIGGTIPDGLIFSNLNSAGSITLSGIPAISSLGVFTLSVLDAVGQTFTATISWSVAPSVQVNPDWNATSGISRILNKPTLATIATTGSYTDLSDKPVLSAVALSGSYASLTGTPNLTLYAPLAGSVFTGSVSASSLTATGAVNGASSVISGSVTVGSLTTTGTLSAASLTLTNPGTNSNSVVTKAYVDSKAAFALAVGIY